MRSLEMKGLCWAIDVLFWILRENNRTKINLQGKKVAGKCREMVNTASDDVASTDDGSSLLPCKIKLRTVQVQVVQVVAVIIVRIYVMHVRYYDVYNYKSIL